MRVPVPRTPAAHRPQNRREVSQQRPHTGPCGARGASPPRAQRGRRQTQRPRTSSTTRGTPRCAHRVQGGRPRPPTPGPEATPPTPAAAPTARPQHGRRRRAIRSRGGQVGGIGGCRQRATRRCHSAASWYSRAPGTERSSPHRCPASPGPCAVADRGPGAGGRTGTGQTRTAIGGLEHAVETRLGCGHPEFVEGGKHTRLREGEPAAGGRRRRPRPSASAPGTPGSTRRRGRPDPRQGTGD